MDILIRNSDQRPIYEQIVSQITAQILSGDLRPGEALPSIRALARDLKISVITTKRAYEELESAGLLCTVAGKGCFVSEKNPARVREARQRELEQHLSAAVETAKGSGVPWEDVISALQILWAEIP